MALNKAVFEGTLKRIPQIRELASGARRCDFTVHVLRDRSEDNYDYIDCSAYNKMAESLQYADLTQRVRIRGSIRTWRTESGVKKFSVNVEKWEQIPAKAMPEQDA